MQSSRPLPLHAVVCPGTSGELSFFGTQSQQYYSLQLATTVSVHAQLGATYMCQSVITLRGKMLGYLSTLGMRVYTSQQPDEAILM